MNVRAAQRHAVLQMLNFNQPMEKVGAGSALFDDSHWSNDWKVLVFDRFCRDVISPLVTVKDLRRQGVTLHLELMAESIEALGADIVHGSCPPMPMLSSC